MNNNFEEAKKYFNQALDLKPDYIDAYYFLGLIDERLGNKESAFKRYNTILELNPNDQLATARIKILESSGINSQSPSVIPEE